MNSQLKGMPGSNVDHFSANSDFFFQQHIPQKQFLPSFAIH